MKLSMPFVVEVEVEVEATVNVKASRCSGANRRNSVYIG